VKHFGILILVAVGLGSCGSATDNRTSAGDREAFRIGKVVPPSINKTVTPPKERARLIKMLSKMQLEHHAKALNEIAAR